MNSSIFKVIKKQVEIIEDNCEAFKKEVSRVISEVNEQLKNEKLEQEEREKLLEMRFDLKKIRNILNKTSCKLL